MNHPARLLNVALAFIVFVAMTSVTSCAVTPEALVAQGLLEGEPCGPPCFQGLVPGTSTEEEVRQFLRSGQYAAGPYSVIQPRQGGVLVMKWDRRGSDGEQNTFDIQDGVLSLMSMSVDSDVTLEQVLDRHGNPDHFAAGLKMSGRVYTRVSLFYSQPGMILDLYLYQDVPELKPDTKVVRVWYFEPAPLEQAIATLEGKKGEPLEDFQLEWLNYWHHWEGYGVVETDHAYP